MEPIGELRMTYLDGELQYLRQGADSYRSCGINCFQGGRIGTIVKSMVSVDFFTVPTIRLQVLYVFLVLTHDRRRIVHFNVTAHPTAEWTAQQLREAFPFDQAPRYLPRDRDAQAGWREWPTWPTR